MKRYTLTTLAYLNSRQCGNRHASPHFGSFNAPGARHHAVGPHFEASLSSKQSDLSLKLQRESQLLCL